MRMGNENQSDSTRKSQCDISLARSSVANLPMPKRRFSTFVSSPSSFISPSKTTSSGSSATTQPEFLPPITIKILKTKKSFVTATEITYDPTSLSQILNDFIYVCIYCKHTALSFKDIRNHWFETHKMSTSNASTFGRFCFQITKRVRCIYCLTEMTYQGIHNHILTMHQDQQYAFAKSQIKIECGLCQYTSNNWANLKLHFNRLHMMNASNVIQTEPMEFINNQVLERLLDQGSTAEYKCSLCTRFFPSLENYENHHKNMHKNQIQSFEVTRTNTVTYGCPKCHEVFTDENKALKHVRVHIVPLFQCDYCQKVINDQIEMKNHLKQVHRTMETNYQTIDSGHALAAYLQMRLTFSNGLQVIWGDVINTKYGGRSRLLRLITEMHDLNASSSSAIPTIGTVHTTSTSNLIRPQKINCKRRLTLL